MKACPTSLSDWAMNWTRYFGAKTFLPGKPAIHVAVFFAILPWSQEFYENRPLIPYPLQPRAHPSPQASCYTLIHGNLPQSLHLTPDHRRPSPLFPNACKHPFNPDPPAIERTQKRTHPGAPTYRKHGGPLPRSPIPAAANEPTSEPPPALPPTPALNAGPPALKETDGRSPAHYPIREQFCPEYP